MAVSAYVLVNVEGAKTKNVLSKIKKIKGVKSANLIAGPYDLVALVQGKNQDEVGELVISKIRKTQGVTNTLTCFIVG